MVSKVLQNKNGIKLILKQIRFSQTDSKLLFETKGSGSVSFDLLEKNVQRNIADLCLLIIRAVSETFLPGDTNRVASRATCPYCLYIKVSFLNVRGRGHTFIVWLVLSHFACSFVYYYYCSVHTFLYCFRAKFRIFFERNNPLSHVRYLLL